MLKKTTITISGLIGLIGVMAGIKVLQFQTMFAAGAAMIPPPEPVTTAVVAKEAWAPTIDAIGSLTAVQGVTVAAELDGKVVHLAFEPGGIVRAGDLLLQQDTSTEEAQLRSAEASVALARINLERARGLKAQSTISQAELDSADAQFKQATAQADNIRATISKKTICAPFDGRLGIRLVNLGQSLKSGDAIVSLQALDPIYVNFLLPQQRLSQLARGLVVRVVSDAVPGQVMTGRITAINPDVDSATRNVRVQATLANPGEQLRPGMFANVSVVLPSTDEVLAIPATAVLYAPYGNSVFVVEAKADSRTSPPAEILRQQLVRLGVRRGDFVAVVSGLKAGETVVTTGVFKLRNGGAVTVDNSLAPDAQLAPHPGDS
jgi:membrane fusion protein (multidrug efflux system)